MKKLSIIILSLLIISLVSGCQNNESKEAKKTDTTSVDKKDEEVQKKIYKQNEEAFITNENGEKIYSLTINSAKAIGVPADYVEEMPKDTKKILVLDYTFKYINEDKKLEDGLRINPWDLQVFDENGMSIEHIDLAGSNYPFDADIYFTEGLNAGRSKQIYAGYSLKNDTKIIQIDFKSPSFKRNLTFELPIEGR
ncbi:hypothetical protein [Neobacillus mesonae]|uniref:hypothetical protein n=1 Tax=Neobacillus mesonae TaxID=1193713 RepID=UPI00082C2BD5|nr:hypothetical protein [Neobacillus mesonae]